MTTIAYKHPTLSADSRAMSGYVYQGSITKIARREDGHMCGAAGDATYNFAFLKWFLAGEIGEPPKANESDNTIDRGVIFRPDGLITVYEPKGCFNINAPYYAIGSGKETALGAMFWSHSSEEAVQAAAAHDPGTGGVITTLRHDAP